MRRVTRISSMGLSGIARHSYHVRKHPGRPVNWCILLTAPLKIAMDLDPRICLQARLTRDPRFDGRFFVGVRSTRIYCRSTCPVRTVKDSNVRYFPTAAAAAEAGYRPCLRCRPESAPGTPAWLGT